MIVFPLLYGCVYVGNSYENEVYEVNNGYSDEELCDMARNYYAEKHGKIPPQVEVDHIDEDGTVVIHLYEVVDYPDEEPHTATWDWYYIDRKTGEGKDFINNEVSLIQLYP